jgi:hypothetical protein
LRAITDGAGTIDFAMTAVLLIAAFFYGASVCLAYLSGDDQPAHDRDKLIVVASACTVGMTLLFVIMARTQAGLL